MVKVPPATENINAAVVREIMSGTVRPTVVNQFAARIIATTAFILTATILVAEQGRPATENIFPVPVGMVILGIFLPERAKKTNRNATALINMNARPLTIPVFPVVLERPVTENTPPVAVCPTIPGTVIPEPVIKIVLLPAEMQVRRQEERRLLLV